MSDLLRHFQVLTGTPVTRLEGGASSREALARAFLAALERGDRVAVERMVVTASEFGHLYFPESIFMRPPYELDPAVVWMQLDAATTTGMRRALQHYSGDQLEDVDLVCSAPDRQGRATIHGCDVRRVDARGDTIRERMFGPILEWGGSFKFLSLQNKL